MKNARSRLGLAVLGIAVLGAGWLWGVLTVRERIFPYGVVVGLLDASRREMASDSRPVAWEPSKLFDHHVRVANTTFAEVAADPAVLRRALISAAVLPDDLVTVSSAPLDEHTTVLSARFYGIDIHARLERASAPADCLIIYHQGHRGNPYGIDYFERIRQGVADRGCDLLAFSMLGQGLSSGPAWFPSRLTGTEMLELDPAEAAKHNNYYSFSDPDRRELTPIALFLSGQYHLIDRVAQDYAEVAMLGISGGGWYTTMLAALIPEIDLSISYAGTLPLSMRRADDWEQTFDPFWQTHDYWHMYFLGLFDQREEAGGRKVQLVYNSYDPCCFADPWATELHHVMARVGEQAVQSGITVRVENSWRHEIDPEVAFSILDDFVAGAR